MIAAVTSEEMRSAEREAATRGLTGTALMQLAGKAAAEHLLHDLKAVRKRYLVLVGPGNNGGDALVVAALLVEAGAEVRCARYRRPSAPSSTPDPPGVTALATSQHFDCGTQVGLQRLNECLQWCDVILDGILGTGRSRPPEDDLRAILLMLRSVPPRVRVVALDLPTGVDPDGGEADPLAVQAGETLCMAYLKRGLLVYPARAHCGDLHVLDIGLPKTPRVPVATSIPEPADIARLLPARTATTQKYSAGALLVIAGSPQYLGAPVLTCTSALRSGAGYVSLALSAEALPLIGPRLLETTLIRLDAAHPFETLHGVASRYHALVVGPGIGRAEQSASLVLQVLSGDLPGVRCAVVDADALYVLAQTPDWYSKLRLPMVLTPHTGEMARLTGLTSEHIESHRFEVAEQFARRWGHVVILKGAPTVVAFPSGSLSCNPTGNPLLATAGTGDVLSGCVGALLAGGATREDAARGAVYLHGLAADLAQHERGDRGLLAGDLLDLLPRAMAAVTKQKA